MKKQQAGFTLIELVLVIVILGILAATALPRFSDLAGDARTAAVKGLAGAIRSAAALAHATQLAKSFSAGQSVTMEGQSVLMTFGYPSTNNISVTLTDYTGFAYNGTGQFDSTGGTANGCTVTYAQPSAANTAPTITATTTSC